MNNQMKKLWIITSSFLLLIIVFVPYVEERCNSTTCINTGSGYTFAGSVGWGQEINIPLLIIELAVVVIISGSYYYFAIKDK